MNSLKNILLGVLSSVLLTSCVKEVTLTPFELPDLVQSFVRKVECFDQESAALIATDEGVLLLFADKKDQVIYDADLFPELNLINWEESEVLYSSATETFWVIQDSVFMNLDRSKSLTVHEDQTQFNISTSSYFDYTLSNDGELYRIGFYKEIWAGSSSGFTTDLYIGIYRFIGNQNNTWQEFQTEMIVKSDFQTDPNSIFMPSGELLILTNPQFVVSIISQTNTEFTLLGKAGSGFSYETIYSPYISSTGASYGFDKVPDINSPIQNLIVTQINENEVQSIALEHACDYPEQTQGVARMIDQKEEVARMYLPSFSSNSLGYLLSYDVSSGSCDVLSLEPNSILNNSSSIQDLDVMDNTVYIGTRNGLFVYDLQTRTISSYINELLDYYL